MSLRRAHEEPSRLGRTQDLVPGYAETTLSIIAQTDVVFLVIFVEEFGVPLTKTHDIVLCHGILHSGASLERPVEHGGATGVECGEDLAAIERAVGRGALAEHHALGVARVI